MKMRVWRVEANDNGARADFVFVTATADPDHNSTTAELTWWEPIDSAPKVGQRLNVTIERVE